VELVFRRASYVPPATAVDVVLSSGECIPLEMQPGELVKLRGLDRVSFPPGALLLLTLMALLHYIDLMVPELEAGRPTGGVGRKPGRERRAGTTREVSRDVVERRIPRKQRAHRGEESLPSSRRGRSSASAVDAFRRRLPPGQVPSLEKILEAESYGIDLGGPGYPSVKYTWVRPHVRGETGSVPRYVYRDYRASTVLETIFDALELSDAVS